MRVFWIFILACAVSWSSGFNVRRVRQVDDFTRRLELKLLRSSVGNPAALPNQKIPDDQGENVAYSLPNTFIIKQHVPVAAVSTINARPLPISLSPSFRADVIEDDVIFEEDIGDNVTADSMEVIELPNSMEDDDVKEVSGEKDSDDVSSTNVDKNTNLESPNLVISGNDNSMENDASDERHSEGLSLPTVDSNENTKNTNSPGIVEPNPPMEDDFPEHPASHHIVLETNPDQPEDSMEADDSKETPINQKVIELKH